MMYDGPLNVNRDLDLRETKITSLPDNLTVGWSLYLSGTKITSLPDNLTVGVNLYLNRTKIKALPDKLTVGGNVYTDRTQIPALFKDDRGYELRRIVLSDGEWFIAGCRRFRRQEALDHWGSPDYPDQDRGLRFVEAINASNN